MKQADKMRHFEVEERNAVVGFINECCELDHVSEVKTSELYERYIHNCDHDLIVGKNKFIQLLREETARSGFSISAVKTSAYRGWKGISLASKTVTNTNPLKEFDPMVDGLLGVDSFIKNMCVVGRNEYVKPSELYLRYIDWVKNNYTDDLDVKLMFGIHTLASKTRMILTRQKVPFDFTTYKGSKWFRGIGIKSI